MYEIYNLKKLFSEKVIINDISFNIEKGKIVGILGENGAGKTTLIKILLKALKSNGGKIIYDSQDLKNISNNNYFKSVSAVLEGNRNLYWYLTGMENIIYFGRLKKLNDNYIQTKSKELLNLFDLYGDKDKKVSNYSRGMQQKLSVIIALLGEPKVLFLDEPTLGLDLITKNSMMECLKHLSIDKNVTIIITSHQLEVIDDIADNIILLENGHIVYNGKPIDFKKKFSKDKYTITLLGDVKINEECENYFIIKKENVTEIIMENIDYKNAINMIYKLHENNSEIISFRKDTYNLENIMENYFIDNHEYKGGKSV